MVTATSKTSGKPWRHPRKQIVEEIFNELIASDTTALALTGLDDLGKATLANLVAEYAETADKGRFQVTINREIVETESFRDLVLEILNALGIADLDLTTLQDDLDGVIRSEPLQVSLASVLYGAIRTANPPVLIVLKRFDLFFDRQSGEALHPEVKEWLRKLNEDRECKSRVLLTSSINLASAINWVRQPSHSSVPTISAHNLDISARQTVPIGDVEFSTRPTVPIDDVEFLLDSAVPMSNTDRLKIYSKPLGVTIDEGVEMLKHWGLGHVPAEYLREAARRCGANPQGGYALIRSFQLLPQYLGAVTLQTALSTPAYNVIWTGIIPEKLFKGIWIKLNSDQRYLLQGLSVYRELVGMDVIQSLSVGGSTTQPMLTLLSLISLFLVESPVDGLYRLHPTLKDFVYSTLPDQEQKRLHTKAAYYYSQRAISCPPPGHRKRVKDIDAIMEQVWHRGQAGQSEVAFEVMRQQQIFPLLKEWREYQSVSSFCAMLLNDKQWQAQPEDKALLYQSLGWADMGLGKYQEAETYFNQALMQSIQNQQDRIIEAETHYNLAILHQKIGQNDEAKDELQQALRITTASSRNKSREIGLRSCRLFGDICLEEGNFKQAEEYYKKALQLLDQSPMRNDSKAKADIHCRLGKLYRKRFDREKAIQSYEDAKNLYQKAAGKLGEAYTLNRIGKMLKEQGEFHSARTKHQQAYNLYVSIPSGSGMADSCNYGGDACLLGERVDLARSCFEEALKLYEQNGIEIGEAKSLLNMGRVCDMEAKNNNPDKLKEALSYYDQARKLTIANGYKRLEGWILSHLGLVFQKQGENKKAHILFDRALKAHVQANDDKAKSFTLVYHGQLCKMEGEQLRGQMGDEQTWKDYFSQALNHYKLALLIHRDQKNWMVGVPAMHDRGVVMLNLNPESDTGVAYLLCARQHDVSDCASRFSKLIQTSIMGLIGIIDQSKYDQIEARVKRDPCDIVDANLNDPNG